MNPQRWPQRLKPGRILDRLRHRYERLLQRNRVVFFRCDPSGDDAAASLQLVEADARLIEQWRSESGFPWPDAGECARRCAEGHRLYALTADGRPCCYGWAGRLQTFWLEELRQSCSLGSPMTWIWDCVTPAALRNHGHYTAFLRALRHRFRDRDLIIFCHAMNHVSYRAILRAGFRTWSIVTQSPRGTAVRFLDQRFGQDLHPQAIVRSPQTGATAST